MKDYLAGAWARTAAACVIAAGAIVLDHLTKAAAAIVEPDTYLLNPDATNAVWIVPALLAVGAAVPWRPVAWAAGLAAGGGASNMIDVYLWPGGVPDFIPMHAESSFLPGDDYVGNVADVFIDIGAMGVPLLTIAAPIVLAARATYRAQARSARESHAETT